MEQRSADWFAARLGKVTASRVADVCARTKNGYGASRKNYMVELVAERITGIRQEGYTNAAMQWGVDNENEITCIAYEFYRDATVEEVGFVAHPSIADTGASPDGLVGADGLVEIKAPNTATHIETLLGAPIPEKYVLQMQWQMTLHRTAMVRLRQLRPAPVGSDEPACHASDARRRGHPSSGRGGRRLPAGGIADGGAAIAAVWYTGDRRAASDHGRLTMSAPICCATRATASSSPPRPIGQNRPTAISSSA